MPPLQQSLPRMEEQLTLPLPPIPKIKANYCQYCHGIHMNVRDFVQCRESNT